MLTNYNTEKKDIGSNAKFEHIGRNYMFRIKKKKTIVTEANYVLVMGKT